MIISVEISYYSLDGDTDNAINRFLELISNKKDIDCTIGKMSTVLTGEYKSIMNLLQHSIFLMMEQHPSVFNVKLSNACPV